MLKLNIIRQITASFFLILIFINCSFSQEQHLIDSINTIINSSKDTTKVISIISLGDLYEKTDYLKAIEIYNQAFELCNNLDNNADNNQQMIERLNSLRAISLLYIGIVYTDNSDFDNALKYLNKSKEFAILSKNKKRIIDCENNIGNIYVYKGDYDLATDYYLNALKISEAENDISNISKATNNLGIIHYRLENFDKAIEYFNKSIKACIKINDKKGAAYTLNNIGNIFLQADKLDSALNYFHRAKAINEEENDLKGISRCLNNLGIIYKRKKDYNKALKYYNDALQINYQRQDNIGITSCLNNIGIVHFENNRFDNAIEYASKMLDIASKYHLKEEKREAYDLLTDCYKKKSNFKLAFDYLKLSNKMSDTLYNDEKTRAINEIDAKYQDEKKQLQIDNLHKDNALKESELAKSEEQRAKQLILIYSFILGLITTIIFSILLFRLFRQKKKANTILSVQKKEIEEKNKNLEFANAEILQQKEEILAQAELLEQSNKELEKLSIAVSETDNSIIIADNRGNIEWVNSGFTKLFGFSITEFKETNGNNIIDASSYNDIETIFNKCLTNKQSVNYIALNKTKDNKSLWIQTTLTPILNSNNEVIKFIAIDSDISKIKEAEIEIIKQKELIEIQNKEITDSINYACNIQTAILPPNSIMQEILGDYFILFKPKNIVSGDFYWTKKIVSKQLSADSNQLIVDSNQTSDYQPLPADLFLVAVADCTGHGVPGALMSMLGISLLNEITNEKIELNKIETYTGIILDKLKENIIKILHQTGSESDSQDGIDMALCLINKNDKTLYYSGANNPIYIISNNDKTELIEIKSNKNHIGFSHNFNNSNFSNNKYKYKSGDSLYLFSDGLADQFGGLQSKKLKYSGLKSIFENICINPMNIQKDLLETKISEWMNPNDLEQYSQLDDITILGIKL